MRFEHRRKKTLHQAALRVDLARAALLRHHHTLPVELAQYGIRKPVRYP
jgi:hypothetical protein